MITYEEALDICKRENPNLIPSGKSYFYKNAFYIEMTDKDHADYAMIIDGYYRVDANNKKVRPFIAGIDGIPKASEMKWLE